MNHARQTSTRAAAERLHGAAIHLLRRVRRYDDASGLPPAQLSALSVLVFGGALSLGALAEAEHVRPPTMTRLVDALERAGLAQRERDDADRRRQVVVATAAGKRLLSEGRGRRVDALTAALGRLSVAERKTLSAALDLVERVIPLIR